MHIFVIAGTSEAAEIIEYLNKEHKITASFATNHGRTTIKKNINIDTITERMPLDRLINVFENINPDVVIDASHPYAQIITQNAIKATKALNIPYYRFEREKTHYNYNLIKYVSNYEMAAKLADKIEGNILLLTGSKTLNVFKEYVRNFSERCYVRILPDSKIIKNCEDMELSSKNIFAMRGPFSTEMNLALIHHVNAKVIITKDTGTRGGLKEKIQAAKAEKIQVIIISCPEYKIDKKYTNIQDLLNCINEMKES